MARLGRCSSRWVGPAAAAAQFMWEQVAATDFDARIDLLDAELHIAEILPLFLILVWRLAVNPP